MMPDRGELREVRFKGQFALNARRDADGQVGPAGLAAFRRQERPDGASKLIRPPAA
jgi:hypothetical protein